VTKNDKRSQHGLSYCRLCLRDRHVFLHEQRLYWPRQLKRHLREGDNDDNDEPADGKKAASGAADGDDDDDDDNNNNSAATTNNAGAVSTSSSSSSGAVLERGTKEAQEALQRQRRLRLSSVEIGGTPEPPPSAGHPMCRYCRENFYGDDQLYQVV
jgi:hypothetical protein